MSDETLKKLQKRVVITIYALIWFMLSFYCMEGIIGVIIIHCVGYLLFLIVRINQERKKEQNEVTSDIPEKGTQVQVIKFYCSACGTEIIEDLEDLCFNCGVPLKEYLISIT